MWLLALSVVALSTYVTASVIMNNDIDQEIDRLVQTMREAEAVGCIVSDPSMICDVYPDDQNMLPSGTLCLYVDKPGSEIICNQQKWKSMKLDADIEVHKISKRSHETCTRIRSRRRWYRRRRNRSIGGCTKINHRPSFESCPIVTKTTPSKATSMIVTWDTPTAQDEEDGALSVRRTSGEYSGNTLAGSTSGSSYSAYYKATDSAKAEATCQVRITVKVIVCPIPSSPANGIVTCPNGRNYGWQCTFSCTDGYLPSISTITCLSNGEWTDQGKSECLGVVCPQQLPVIDNGYYVCDGYTYGSTCRPVCEPAYNDSTNYPISCTRNGQWTEPQSRVCKDTNPPILLGCPTDITIAADLGMTSAIVTWVIPTASDPEDGTATVKQTIGSISPGQRVEGDDEHQIAYRAFDSSDNPSSQCSFTVKVEVTRCPAISALTNGVYSCSESNLYGSQCTFTCHTGYLLQGASQVQCEQTGLWDTSMPTCSEIVCYTPDHYGHFIENGYYDECPSTITYQASCKAKCYDGYQLEQTVTAVCVVDSNSNPGYSIPQTPVCEDKEPPTFPTCGDNTVVLTFDAIKGTRRALVDYTIPVGIDNNDPSPVVTKLHGTEVGDTISADTIERVEFQATDAAGNPSTVCVYQLQVQVLECAAYIPPEHGEMICTVDSIYGSICTLRCDDGYQPDGLDHTECLQDGSWSVNTLECVEKICPTGPSAPLNGVYDCYGVTTYPFNTICSPLCDEGFTLLQKSSYARCDADQTWEIFNSPECKDTTPPSFTDCVNSLTVNAEKQLTSAIVTWVVPVATDNVDTEPTVTQTSGPTSGSRIEGTVIVKYEAKDSAGNPDICEMEIDVEVIQCPSPTWTPYVATISCGHGTLYGSLCQYTCEEGFEVSEPSTVECLDDSSWSYGFQPPTCSRITCDAPDAATNGIFYCPDTSYEYESICYLHCDSGFSVDKPVSVECDEDGQWILKSTEQCTDTVPPTLYGCEQNQLLQLDRGKDTVVANWILPMASDNVDNVADITIELISVTDGAESGADISVGTYLAEYRARDTSGNPSVGTCAITLTVEEITCSEPKYSFADNNLLYNCTSYRWGDNCTLSCTTVASYTFNGPDIITCEKTYWSYEGLSQPYCEEAACQQDLNVPRNGAVVYTDDALPVALMTCASTHDLEYGLPYEFSGYSFCVSNTDGSYWTINPLPDCTRSFRPGLNLLPMEYYYEGDCNDPAVQEEIKEQLKATLLDVFVGTDYDCISDNTCGVDDFVVGCEDKRKKRDTEDHNIVKKQTESTVKVELNLFLEGSIESFADVLMFEEQLISMYDHLADKCGSTGNECDLEGYAVVPGTFVRRELSRIECQDPGHVLEGLSCKACAMGYFMQNIDGTKECVKCPVGTYSNQDSAANCTSCPTGTSTLNIGSKSIDMCIDLCPAGSQSSSGLKPCTPCQQGYYKDTIGQGSCMSCSPGQTSFAPGQTSCSSYDVALSGDLLVDIHQTTIPIDKITTVFWILKGCESLIGTDFATSVLGIEISDAIFINGVSVLDYTPYCDMWTHIAISIDNTGYSLYINGDLMMSDTDPLMGQLPDNSAIQLGFTTDIRDSGSSVIVSSYSIFPRLLTTEEIGSYQSSCYNEVNDAILTTDDIIHIYEGIEAKAPTCIAINHCLDAPCGSSQHLCTPTIDSFVCTCSDGYTGVTCETPPDFCEQNDCQNGATCVNHDTNYTCTCPLGYSGKFCKTAPVIGGWGDWSKWGTCSALCDGGVRQRTRVCDNPAPGDYGIPCSGDSLEEETCNLISCEIAFPCSVEPCGEHTCRETSTGFLCECNPGYTGTLCLDVIDNCDPNPCQNDGTCINKIVDFECECPDRYSGDVCEEKSNSRWYWSPWSQCSVTCGGGTSTRHLECVSGLSYCPDEEQSKDCNLQPCPVDNCEPLSCNNHGTCISSGDDYSCICETGYTGKSCDPVDFCTTNPCVHGQCSNTGTSYLCTCELGFTGTQCETAAEKGNWGDWNSWGSCDVTCGPGTKHRTRSCDNPSPGPGGMDCDGIDTESVECNVECYDSCMSNPCGSDHNCVEESNSYTCHCRHGYSGTNCLTPPDVCDPNPCENGAVCRSNGNKPECDCINGYTGLLCTVHPDVSVWNPWADWTECSVTCGGGSRSRTRECKPGSQGDSCDGSDTDIGNCGLDVCPSCPDLPKFFQMDDECIRNDIEKTVECTLSCKPGNFPSHATQGQEGWWIKYICGPFTSYTWNTTDRTVACTAGVPPGRFMIPVIMPFVQPSSIPCSKQESVKAQLMQKLPDVVCQAGTPCDIQVSLPKCTTNSRRKKRDVATEIEMDFTLDLSAYTGENSGVDFWQVANESLSPLVTTTGTWLTVEVDGTTYAVDTTNFTDDVIIECDEGFFLQEGYAVCAGCVPGSWFDSSIQDCQLCPVGSYQEKAGQLQCDSCPDGYTTPYTGSMDKTECTYVETSNDNEGSELGMIIGASVGGVVIMCIIVGIALYIVKRKNKTKVLASLVNVREYESQGMPCRQKPNLSYFRSPSALSSSDIPVKLPHDGTHHGADGITTFK